MSNTHLHIEGSWPEWCIPTIISCLRYTILAGNPRYTPSTQKQLGFTKRRVANLGKFFSSSMDVFGHQLVFTSSGCNTHNKLINTSNIITPHTFVSQFKSLQYLPKTVWTPLKCSCVMHAKKDRWVKNNFVSMLSSYPIYPIVWLTVGAPLYILQPASSTPRGSQLSVAVYSIQGQSTLWCCLPIVSSVCLFVSLLELFPVE